jgi:hypothetical protein
MFSSSRFIYLKTISLVLEDPVETKKLPKSIEENKLEHHQ